MLARLCSAQIMWHMLLYHSVLSAVQLGASLIAFTENMASNNYFSRTNAAAEKSTLPPALEIQLHQDSPKGVYSQTNQTCHDERVHLGPHHL